jgi:hypothetical protein
MKLPFDLMAKRQKASAAKGSPSIGNKRTFTGIGGSSRNA